MNFNSVDEIIAYALDKEKEAVIFLQRDQPE